jgi:hypothetical protein
MDTGAVAARPLILGSGPLSLAPYLPFPGFPALVSYNMLHLTNRVPDEEIRLAIQPTPDQQTM